MIANKLDYDLEKIETVRLSNDAYYNLAFGEECLDENNLSNVKDFKKRFPYGFKFASKAESVKNSDLVECKIVPIRECNTPFTHYRIHGKWYKSEFYYSEDKKQAYYRIYNMYDGYFTDYGWNEVHTNQYGRQEIRPGKCIFPLQGKSWIEY